MRIGWTACGTSRAGLPRLSDACDAVADVSTTVGGENFAPPVMIYILTKICKVMILNLIKNCVMSIIIIKNLM